MDGSARDELIVSGLQQVRLIAKAFAGRGGAPQIAYDDLQQEGMLGLVRAARDFDPKAGVQFKTYAEHRIRGAILDFLRREHPLKRKQRQLLKTMEAAWLRAAQKTMRMPEEDEVAAESGLSPAEYRQRLREAHPVKLESLNDGNKAPELIDLRPNIAELCERQLEQQHRLALVDDAIEKLPDREKDVMKMKLAGLSKQRIAELFRVHQSRVSQLEAAAVRRIQREIYRPKAA